MTTASGPEEIWVRFELPGSSGGPGRKLVILPRDPRYLTYDNARYRACYQQVLAELSRRGLAGEAAVSLDGSDPLVRHLLSEGPALRLRDSLVRLARTSAAFQVILKR